MPSVYSWSPFGTRGSLIPEEEVYSTKLLTEEPNPYALPSGWELDPLNISTYTSFSGADISATMAYPGSTGEVVTFAELSTISYSITRDKRPLRLLGYTNPVNWSKSIRMVAGTLVFASFDRYVWGKFIDKKSIDFRGMPLADMLPPFDVTISAMNEYGQISRLSIRGVRIVDEGSVIGVNDMFVEQTHTYVAQDVIPWTPDSTGTPRAVENAANEALTSRFG